ncbi:TerB family tellurite resistance protein [Gammaproteobacteria bacterium]|nr:TerB family tellurite resistance protein [Gammaproteobacteria bacterium]
MARSDGEISESELEVLLSEIKKIATDVGKTEQDILNIIEEYSKNSISFHEFIEDINKDFTKEDKLSLIRFLWDVAYADTILEVNEERLIRRIADLINIKDLEVLKLKDKSKSDNLD